MRRLAACRPGRRVGLLGGSFDPPHLGHVHISLWALRRFHLDAVWWLFSPGNPLKENSPAPFAERRAMACALIAHPAITMADLESPLGSRRTIDLVRAIQQCQPSARFIWLMGSDGLGEMHRWHAWQDIFARLPVGILARRHSRHVAINAPVCRAFASCRLAAANSQMLGHAKPPAWCLIDIPLNDESSTRLRTRSDSINFQATSRQERRPE